MGWTRAQALDALQSHDLIGIGMEADGARRGVHPEGVVSYVIERIVACGLSPMQRYALMIETEAMGGTGIMLEPAADAGHDLAWYEALLRDLRHRFPGLTLHGLTATEILRLANTGGRPLQEVLFRLRMAGLTSLGGADALLLVDEFRIAMEPTVCTSAAWVEVHRTAHRFGLLSVAAMVFGAGEPLEARVAHLEAIAGLQAETGGFVAFTPIAYSPKNPPPTHRTLDEATAVDYLTTLAVSRLMLDGIGNIEAASQGLKVQQMALRFGANDVGPVLLDEHAIKLAGPSNCATEEELRRIIRDAGFEPVQRDSLYGSMFLV